MSIAKNGKTLSARAAGTVREFRFVAGSSASPSPNDSPLVVEAGVDSVPLGIAIPDGGAASGDLLAYQVDGSTFLFVDASDTAITNGAPLTCGADGVGLAAGEGDAYYAIALAAKASGTGTVPVLVVRGYIPVEDTE